MLSPQSWLPKAEGLEIGRKRRTDHDCGGGRTLIVSRDIHGYRAYCFRCGEAGVAKPPQESLAERTARIRLLQAGDALLHRQGTDGRVHLPVLSVRDVSAWPDSFRVWLAKAGLGASEIGRLGAYYHPPSDRLVLPVFEGSTPVFWQARSLHRQPKYLAPEVDRALVVPRWGSSPSPTLTEDILSAFKVGQVGEGWALMGTRVSTRVINMLLSRGCSVNVWLDPDPAGQRGATKVIKQLRAVGIRCRNIVSTVDPKLVFYSEIKELLNEDR